MHPPTTTEMTGRNRALNAARNGQKRQKTAFKKRKAGCRKSISSLDRPR